MPNNEQESGYKNLQHLGSGHYVDWYTGPVRNDDGSRKRLQLTDRELIYTLSEKEARELYRFLAARFGPKTWTDMMNQYAHIREARTVTQQIRTLNGGG